MDDDDLQDEYDFEGGVRGKHYQALREGHSVRVHRSDGSTNEQHFQLEDGAIMLDPNLRPMLRDNREQR